MTFEINKIVSFLEILPFLLAINGARLGQHSNVIDESVPILYILFLLPPSLIYDSFRIISFCRNTLVFSLIFSLKFNHSFYQDTRQHEYNFYIFQVLSSPMMHV